MGQDGNVVVRENFDCLTEKQKLPSYVLENSELTELCVRAKGEEEWSQDVCLAADATEHSFFIQVRGSQACPEVCH